MPSLELTIAALRSAWLRVLVGGGALYALLTAAALTTDSVNLMPAVLLLCAGLIPVAFVVWASDRLAVTAAVVPALGNCFVVGGVFGVAAASVLEYQTLRDLGTLPMLAVGLIEETVKLAVPVVLLVRGRYRAPTHGMLFGVAAGMGFAVMVTMGYGLGALIQSGGRLGAAEQVLLLRGVLSAIGHAAWTGLAAAALWHLRGHARSGRAWLRLGVAFTAAVALHTLWDSTDSTLARAAIGVCSGTLLLAQMRRLRRAERAAVAVA